MSWQTTYHSRIQHNALLSRYTAARLGGPADWLIIADRDSADLAAIVSAAWAEDTPVRVLGGGANVLISDAGFRGLIVINDVATVRFEGSRVLVSAGYGLTRLARLCAAHALTGFEWAASVPGTVGGAIVNNAGAHNGDMAGNLTRITLIDAYHAEPYTLTAGELAYGYRTSALKAWADRRFLVLDAELHLASGDPAEITAAMETFIAYRKRTQPPGASLGSIFKNPPGDHAGRLIEVSGLKGLRIGGAQVSPVHANFFINTGNATAGDYAALIEVVQLVVQGETGVRLEPEIERLGF